MAKRDTYQQGRHVTHLLPGLKVEKPCKKVSSTTALPANSAVTASSTGFKPDSKYRGYRKRGRNAQKIRKTNNSNDDDEPSTLNNTTTTEVDINTIPVTISVRYGDAYRAQIFPGVPVIKTTLGEADTYYKVFTHIRSNPDLTTPLTSIYNLSTADHKETVLCFTQPDGTRMHAALLYYAEPTINGDQLSIGATTAEWKRKITTGELAHTPQCFCLTCNDGPNGRPHGVEIFEILRLDGLVDICLAAYRQRISALEHENQSAAAAAERALASAPGQIQEGDHCLRIPQQWLLGEYEVETQGYDDGEDEEIDGGAVEEEEEDDDTEYEYEVEEESESESTDGSDGSEYEP